MKLMFFSVPKHFRPTQMPAVNLAWTKVWHEFEQTGIACRRLPPVRFILNWSTQPMATSGSAIAKTAGIAGTLFRPGFPYRVGAMIGTEGLTQPQPISSGMNTQQHAQAKTSPRSSVFISSIGESSQNESIPLPFGENGSLWKV
jgi:hypothetical protein